MISSIMNFEDFIIAPRRIRTEKWQIGDKITNEIKEDSIVLLFVSDYRGADGDARQRAEARGRLTSP